MVSTYEYIVVWRADVDECAEQQVQCPANQKCFNKRGGYECVDTSCPPSYDRDPNTGYYIYTTALRSVHSKLPSSL